MHKIIAFSLLRPRSALLPLLVSICLMLGLTFGGGAHARDYSYHAPQAPLHRIALKQAKKNSGISKAQAAATAKAQYGGKVVSVSKSGSGYRVKLLLKDGRVKVVTISQ